jgi:hypothetical protein
MFFVSSYSGPLRWWNHAKFLECSLLVSWKKLTDEKENSSASPNWAEEGVVMSST